MPILLVSGPSRVPLLANVKQFAGNTVIDATFYKAGTTKIQLWRTATPAPGAFSVQVGSTLTIDPLTGSYNYPPLVAVLCGLVGSGNLVFSGAYPGANYQYKIIVVSPYYAESNAFTTVDAAYSDPALTLTPTVAGDKKSVSVAWGGGSSMVAGYWNVFYQPTGGASSCVVSLASPTTLDISPNTFLIAGNSALQAQFAGLWSYTVFFNGA